MRYTLGALALIIGVMLGAWSMLTDAAGVVDGRDGLALILTGAGVLALLPLLDRPRAYACPVCGGDGRRKYTEVTAPPAGHPNPFVVMERRMHVVCEACHGTGRVTL